MNIGGVNSAGIANSVWTNATRNLTGMNSAVMVIVTVVAASLANATQVDLRPAAGKFRDICVVISSLGAAGSALPSCYDGTTFRSMVAVTNQMEQYILKGSNALGPAINNTGTNAVTYNVMGVDWVQ